MKSLDKVSCFVTGFNYNIISNCSEVAKKMVKRYFGSLVIIGIIWATIGFVFGKRYLGFDGLQSGLLAFVSLLFVILIERNIILASKGNLFVIILRGVLALTMAILGSILIDQIIFDEDIKDAKIGYIQEKVQANYPAKISHLKEQKGYLDSANNSMNSRLIYLSNQISKLPSIKIANTSSRMMTDSKDSSIKRTIQIETTNIPNPQIDELKNLQKRLEENSLKLSKTDSLMTVARETLEEEYRNRNGFLDEITLLFRVIGTSGISVVIYFFWFLLFFVIELFILASKYGENENDYHKLIEQQNAIHKYRIEKLQVQLDKNTP